MGGRAWAERLKSIIGSTSRSLSWNHWRRDVVEETAVLVIGNNEKGIFPDGTTEADSIISLHEKFLPVADSRRCVIICAATNVGSVSVNRFDENNLGEFIGRGVCQVGLEIFE